MSKTEIKQAEILKILARNDRSISWLANKIGYSKQRLSYQLTHSKSLPVDLYDEIIAVMKKENFITTSDHQCQKLIEETFELSSIIGSSLNIINSRVRQFTEDNILTFKEKKKLLELVDLSRERLIEELDEVERVLEGR